MARKRVSTTKETLQPDVDDLKLINGIGPAVEHRLHGVSIFTFAQLAAMSPADIAALVGDISGLTAERISKQNWIGQARDLSLRSTAPIEEQDVERISPQRVSDPFVLPEGSTKEAQRVATFTVELTLNEQREVLSTELVHVQSRRKEQWSGWQEAALLTFLVQQAKIALPEPASSEPTVEIPEPPAADAPVVTPAPQEEEQPSPLAAAASTSRDALRLLEVETALTGIESAQAVLFGDHPFDVRLVLDLAALPAESLYTATISARKLGEHTRKHLAEARGVLMPEHMPVVHVEDITLSPGTYRLEASVSLHARNGDMTASPMLTATKGGSLLHVV